MLKTEKIIEVTSSIGMHEHDREKFEEVIETTTVGMNDAEKEKLEPADHKVLLL
jgi:hypothetical protein